MDDFNFQDILNSVTDQLKVLTVEEKPIVNSVLEKPIQQILEPCKIPKFVDIDILKQFVKKDIDGNKEYFDDLNMTYKISDPKKGEWILSKAIKDSKLIGNGNTYIDIDINNKIGVDVSVLTLNGNNTNEKSIMQNFSTDDLDALFKNNEGEKAVTIFKDKLKEKYISEKEIYYMIFICHKKNIYLSCFKFNAKNISNMKFSGFTTKTCKNISIDNFINDKFGNVKLYKSKKRLELRLYKNILTNECTTLLY